QLTISQGANQARSSVAMTDETDDAHSQRQLPGGKAWEKIARGALQAIGGAIPFAGGLLSAGAGAWSEQEQERVAEFLRAWIQMLEDEIREKEATIAGIVTRLDMQDEAISGRVRSDEYQSLLKKAFRNWQGAESAKKREYIRNILSNAAAASLTSDDVISLFLDWIGKYSELHFLVIADIYHN